MPVIAHLSDTQLDTSEVRTARFARVLRELDLLPQLDALLVSGDLADHGEEAEYAAFFELLPNHVRTIVVPGNHDNRETLRCFLGRSTTGQLDSVLTAGNATIIGLDSLVPGEDRGELADDTIAFARQAIDDAPGPVLLALHHPPVPVGHPFMDRHGLSNPDALRTLITQSGAVAATLTGHVHSALATTFAGRPLVGAPGIVSTMRLGGQMNPIADSAAMPGLAIHTLSDAGHLSSVFHYVSPPA